MKIYIGADHGGLVLKEDLKSWLTDKGYEVIDKGANKLNPKDDYPDFAFSVAEEISKNSDSVGIVICRSGTGAAIAANKVNNIRAVNVFDARSTEHAIGDNNANVITLGADWLSTEQAKELVMIFLESQFSNLERHMRRINKIKKYESLS